MYRGKKAMSLLLVFVILASVFNLQALANATEQMAITENVFVNEISTENEIFVEVADEEMTDINEEATDELIEEELTEESETQKPDKEEEMATVDAEGESSEETFEEESTEGLTEAVEDETAKAENATEAEEATEEEQRGEYSVSAEAEPNPEEIEEANALAKAEAELMASDDACLFSTDARYVVLVLDKSGKMQYLYDGVPFYKVDPSVEDAKKAAKDFARAIFKSNTDTYVAVVAYDSYSTIVSGFSNNLNTVIKSIDGISAGIYTANIDAGLTTAKSLLNYVYGEKNVVLFTTGYTGSGSYNYSGHYDSNTVGSTWVNSDTKVDLYAYANVAYKTAESIKKDSTIYTVGLFSEMNGIPEKGKNIAAFQRLVARDLASSNSTFYAVEKPADLDDVFEFVANEIKDPSVVYSFEATNITNPETPKKGMANKDEKQGTGHIFEFTAVTSKNVEKISICGDKPDETVWHEITYDVLKKNYKLKYKNNSDGTRTWTCRFSINETGNREFMLKLNGHETDYREHLTIFEYQEPTKVTGITLSNKSLSLKVGATATLTATVSPANATNKDVTWKSSKTSVATVSDGKITAKKAGTATITVTTKDGSKKATCTVTVVDAPKPKITSAKVTPTTGKLNETVFVLTVKTNLEATSLKIEQSNGTTFDLSSPDTVICTTSGNVKTWETAFYATDIRLNYLNVYALGKGGTISSAKKVSFTVK